MKAAVLHAPGEGFRIEEVDLAPPRAGEVRVALAASGVCRSDHHLATGATPHPMPVVCGHEAAGVVEEVGPGVTSIAHDDHVILSWAPACGGCFYCERDLPAQCDRYREAIWNGTMLDGSTRLSLPGPPRRSVFHYTALATFAPAAVVPESCCVPIRRDVPLHTAALVGCAVTTGVGAALLRAHVRPGESAAVFGCGGVGISILQAAALAGASPVIAVDPNPDRRKMARRLFGATHDLDPGRIDPVGAIRDATGGRGADCTFEALGDPAVMSQAVEAARRGGRVVLVGLGRPEQSLPLGAADFTRSDKLLTSAYYGGCVPRRDMPFILDLYASGKLKLDEMIGARRPLEEIDLAFDALLSGGVLRTLIVFGDGPRGMLGSASAKGTGRA